MFQCDQCGLCCIGLNKNEELAEFHNGDGICKYLDLDTRRCKIYNDRPMHCRVEDFYKEHLADKMDYDKYIELNYEACEMKKKEFEECGGDIYKMTSVMPQLPPEKRAVINEEVKKSIEKKTD